MKPDLKKLFNLLETKFESLRPWQIKFSEFWEKCANNQLIGIQTPTGSGKTCVALLILEQGRRNGKKCVYLTHTNQLVDRILKEAKKLDIKAKSLLGASGEVGSQFRKRKQILAEFNDREHIIISNYAAFLMTKDFPYNIDYLVIDDVDLFYEYLRDFFSIKIQNSSSTSKVYEDIINALGDHNYSIINKVKEKTAGYYDGNIIFPYDYQIILDIISNNIDVLKNDYNLYKNYQKYSKYFNYFFWYLNKRELTIEPFIFPIEEIEIPETRIKRFQGIDKIILVSATLGTPERVSIELGLLRNNMKFITEKDFEQEGINIQMGDKLIFPIIETKLMEVNPISHEFIENSSEFLQIIESELKKLLILCWETREKEYLINFLKNEMNKVPIFNFEGTNYYILDRFSENKTGVLFIANRYFGLDFPEESCEYCVLTRLPQYTSNYDIILHEYLKDNFYYFELQARRLIQSFGRINRSEKDHKCYFVLDPRFADVISGRKEFFPLLTKELKLRLKYSMRESEYGKIEKAIEEAKKFVKEIGESRKNFKDFLSTEDYEEYDLYEIDKEILSLTFSDEVKAWISLYKNKYSKALELFQNNIDKLNLKGHISQYRRKIEQYNFYKFLILFKLESQGIKDYRKELENLQNLISNSNELIWLNNVVLHAKEDIKRERSIRTRPVSKTQEKFKEYAKNPELYLGDLYFLEEINDHLTPIEEILHNLGSGQSVSPLSTFAVEFERICHDALKKRLQDVYKNLKSTDKLNISNDLNAFRSNSKIRESKYDLLYNNQRGLRNNIIHLKGEIQDVKYEEAISYTNILKEGIKILLKELYFSDMLETSKEFVSEIQAKIEKYNFVSESMIRMDLIELWSKEKVKFDPEIDDNNEITTYSGKLILTVEGREYEIKINLQI